MSGQSCQWASESSRRDPWEGIGIEDMARDRALGEKTLQGASQQQRREGLSKVPFPAAWQEKNRSAETATEEPLSASKTCQGGQRWWARGGLAPAHGGAVRMTCGLRVLAMMAGAARPCLFVVAVVVAAAVVVDEGHAILPDPWPPSGPFRRGRFQTKPACQSLPMERQCATRSTDAHSTRHIEFGVCALASRGGE